MKTFHKISMGKVDEASKYCGVGQKKDGFK